MTATVEPGRADDWDDTGPIPLPPAPESTESLEAAREAPAPLGDSTEAREARYAEALHSSTCRATINPCPYDGNLAWDRWAEAARVVADAEQATLIAERDEARAEAADEAGNHVRYFRRWQTEYRIARAAEAEVRDLRAEVAALADRWASESSKMAVGLVKRGCAVEIRELLATPPVESACEAHGWECANNHALASVGRTEPEAGGA